MCYRCMGAGVIGTYLGVVAVVLRSWCVVLCTVCQYPTGMVFRMGAGKGQWQKGVEDSDRLGIVQG